MSSLSLKGCKWKAGCLPRPAGTCDSHPHRQVSSLPEDADNSLARSRASGYNLPRLRFGFFGIRELPEVALGSYTCHAESERLVGLQWPLSPTLWGAWGLGGGWVKGTGLPSFLQAWLPPPQSACGPRDSLCLGHPSHSCKSSWLVAMQGWAGWSPECPARQA